MAVPGKKFTMEEEIWKPVKGYEGIYEVSNMGNVKRVGRNCGGTVGHILKNGMRGRTYFTVVLYGKGKPRTTCIHELVAAAFIGDRPAGYQVNHKDLVKTNNQVNNLEYISQKENLQHAFANGAFANRKLRAARGERVHLSKLTGDQIPIIREMIRQHVSLQKIADLMGVTKTAIFLIKTGQTWAHIQEGK